MPDLGGFLAALGGAFGGYAQGKKRQFEEGRLLSEDESQRQLRSAQIGNYASEQRAREAKAQQEQADRAAVETSRAYLASDPGLKDLADARSPDVAVSSAARARLIPHLSRVENAGAFTQFLTPPPPVRDPVKEHEAMRKIDVANPLREDKVPLVAVPYQTDKGATAYHYIPKVAGGEAPAPASAQEGAGGARGFGTGGVFGAASGLGSIKEMHAAHPNLAKFEVGLLSEEPNSPTLKYFDNYRAGILNAAKHASGGYGSIGNAISGFINSGAAEEMARMNPALGEYMRNMAQWIVSDLNLTRNASDERGRMDQIASSVLALPLSSMPIANRVHYVHQVIQGRQARLSGLDRVVPAAESMLDRLGRKRQEMTQQPQQP
jgi:hypothetical protein